MVTPKLTFVFDRKHQATNKQTGVVELLISNGTARKYISTGVKLLKKEWSNGSVVGRQDWKELNEQLQIIMKRCSEIVIKMMEEGNFELGAVPGMLKSKLEQHGKEKMSFLSFLV